MIFKLVKNDSSKYVSHFLDEYVPSHCKVLSLRFTCLWSLKMLAYSLQCCKWTILCHMPIVGSVQICKMPDFVMFLKRMDSKQTKQDETFLFLNLLFHI